MKKVVDFLVVGSGIAGLSYAIKVADKGKVCILTKTRVEETATKFAQGGIAAVMYNPDSYEQHIKDTMIAGDYINNEEIVRMTISESTERVKELATWGANFDKTVEGLYDLGLEGGHSMNRVLHHKDNTGEEIERALIKQVKSHPNIEIVENSYAIELITQHHLGEIVTKRSPDICCYGVYALNRNTNEIDTMLSKVTLLATGGIGNVYGHTTNPVISTGDGIAMVHRARGKTQNMEFIQFHPTSLYNPSEQPSFLISEAVRGFGGILRTSDGVAFMDRYDARKSLAPRDIVARAIDNELKIRGEECVYLDCTHLDKNKLIEHFPTIFAKCLSIGIDIGKDMIPVVPAAHYCCGGITVNRDGQSSIVNLYASGECSYTGLHGANRLASNSLLEAVVFSHRAAMDSIRKAAITEINQSVPAWDSEGVVLNEELILVTQSAKELQSIMNNYVGIVRSDLRLQRAADREKILFNETEELYKHSVITPKICELRNMITVAYLIIKAATQRKENKGLHYSISNR